MTVFQAIILGIIQGMTEFLPVSSSGHLAIVQGLFGLDKYSLISFDVLVHLGTLIPVVIVFWEEIFKLVKNPFQKMTVLLIIGTLPAVVWVLILGDSIDMLFSGGLILAGAYVVTGILLWASDKFPEGRKTEKKITPFDALFVGIVQMVAIIPGISRSGSTITASLFRGLDKKTAASFSFLLSIPAILGAFVLHYNDIVYILSGTQSAHSIGLAAGFAGFLAAMISGYIAIRFMLKLIRQRNLKVFSYYVFALAIFLVIDHFVLGVVF